jgi:ribose 5-phosphate isomerase A
LELPERLERLAVATADLVRPGMVIGLGTGSTADAVTRELGRRAAAGFQFAGVPTSQRTEMLARELGIPLTTLDEHEQLDFGFDGVDELDPALNAIKGRGGALLREKLMALACVDYVFVATTEKNVAMLGERMRLPVEVVRFGWKQTASRVSRLGFDLALRYSGADSATPFTTDNGGFVLDCDTGPLSAPSVVADALKLVPGVVDHGLFLGLARSALQVDSDGDVLRRIADHSSSEPVAWRGNC